VRYVNNGPVTLYIVMDTKWGIVIETFIHMKAARWWMTNSMVSTLHPSRYKLLKYDQRVKK
jgi:hypothetical protein